MINKNPYADHSPEPWSCFQHEAEKGSNYWRIKLSTSKFDRESLSGYIGEPNANLIIDAPKLLRQRDEALAKLKRIRELAFNSKGELNLDKINSDLHEILRLTEVEE
jgi:hypothetical protein